MKIGNGLFLKKLSFTILTILIVVSCGGDKRSTLPSPAPDLGVIEFTDDGAKTLYVGQQVQNRVISIADTEISYQSNYPAIANVDSLGVVTALSVGEVNITATHINELGKTLQAAYKVHVIPEQPIDVLLNIGANDTKMNFLDVVGNMSLIRSTDINCDFLNYIDCSDVQIDQLSSTSFTDTTLTIDQPGAYSLHNGPQYISSQLLTSEQTQIYERGLHKSVFFKDKMWVIGGGGYRYLNDIWSSLDGVNWTLEVENADFSARQGHEIFVFDDKLWLIGGAESGNFLADIWSSADGINWQREDDPQNPSFMGRRGHKIYLFNDKLFMFSGAGIAGFFDQIWSSTDGVNWSLETPTSDIPERIYSQIIKFNGRLWMIGGSDGGNSFSSDVLVSDDGINWSLVTDNPGFAPRDLHQVALINDRLFLFGGRDAVDIKTDVWSTDDGENWRKEASEFIDGGRSGHQIIHTDGALYLSGGWYLNSNGLIVVSNDVYTSTDGLDWVKLTPDTRFSPRYYSDSIEFNGKLWMVGGYDGILRGDVWSSTNGHDWVLEVAFAPFNPRDGHQLVVFQNKLWLLGGRGDSRLHDVWYSEDGINWVEQVQLAPYTPRWLHQVVTLNDKLFVIAGRNSSDDYVNDVWSSSDGSVWSKETIADGNIFSPRSNHQAVVFNNRIWIVGGYGVGGHQDDVWSSNDGVNWQLETADASFSTRHSPSLISHNNELWLIGGENSGVNRNDIWTSSNGRDWTLLDDDAEFTPRRSHHVHSFQNKLWLLGGYNGVGMNDIWSYDVVTQDGWRQFKRLRFINKMNN